MKTRVFTCSNGTELIVKHRKSAVIFEMNQNQINNKYNVTYNFELKDFVELYNYIKMIANEAWANLSPKGADSLGSDYYEYYDKELDTNGYLHIRENTIFIDRPALNEHKLYQFNKKKMESFIYDFEKLVKS
ncbi:hypothetical protein G7L40_20140 [Paenibacillus polymyxa]|uniref:Uncharacterized protein n=1 Tax=Paenibacillus polymyxa TaxID=1406 RepID=A0A378XZ18_PAEPO|nr:hypothetical protein [Paenibacillus polymyxa]MBE7896200.1 hypothetical protein [Paenibacillus polymyxa]MBG9765862.1 hypothetical protein [Paenibacillus polymyxa]MCC3256730.1 hypothetical protein [Paenibacillus polymyxa]QPK54783.1 hypothetical protein G7035_20180 [Paenibacillus polymyxa]QPK59874.1 hypothetical protein G7L40_20140 [Paenibacillus polymyxa]